MRRESLDEGLRQLAYLPTPELGHFGDLFDRLRVATGDGFQAVSRAENTGIEL